MNWSGPNVIHFGRKSQFGPDQFILVVTILFWSNHYGQVQINLVRPKPFWTDQNCFGHIEGQGSKCNFRKDFAPLWVFRVSREGKSLGEMKMGLPWWVLTCLLPVWMRSWVFNLWACVKDLPQVWHAKGLSPEWINWKKGMQINDYWVVHGMSRFEVSRIYELT